MASPSEDYIDRVLRRFHAEWAEQMELPLDLDWTPMDDAIVRALREEQDDT
jgi:hypothetical protein